jgi:uncharacterized membrane protein YqhA
MGTAATRASHWGLRLVAVLVAVAVVHLLTEELDFAENAPLQLLVAGVAVLSLIAFVLAAIRSAKALRAS